MQRALTRGAKLAAGFRGQCQASTPVAFARLFASDADLKKTPLYDFHVENGGTQDVVEAMGRVHQAPWVLATTQGFLPVGWPSV